MRAWRKVRVVGSVGILALLVACGGGGGKAPVAVTADVGLTGFAPEGVMPSETQQAFVVSGWGFEPVGEGCGLRLTALEGTPFAKGTGAVLEGQGLVQDEATLVGTLEAALVRPGSGEVQALVEVTLPDARVLVLEGFTARFAELDYALVLLAVTPVRGVTTGGQAVRIDGAGFTQHDPGPPQVYFGDLPATDVTVLDDGTLTCVTPPSASGVVDIRVSNDYATTILEQAFDFTWQPQWDWEYGPEVVKLSEHDHLYTHDLLEHDFLFPFYGAVASRLELFCGWLSLHEAGTDVYLGDVHPLGDCLDTTGEAAAVHLKQLPDRVVLTYRQVHFAHEEPGEATCQVCFHESGAFAVLYREVMPSPRMLVSVFPAGSPGGELAVDWSQEPADPGGLGFFESFGAENPFDLAFQGLLLRPTVTGGYETTLLFLEP